MYKIQSFINAGPCGKIPHQENRRQTFFIDTLLFVRAFESVSFFGFSLWKAALVDSGATEEVTAPDYDNKLASMGFQGDTDFDIMSTTYIRECSQL